MTPVDRSVYAAMTARRRGVWRERALIWLCRGCVYLPLAVLALLLMDVAIDGLRRIDTEFLTAFPSYKAFRAGIYPALMGSLYVTVLTAAIALPVGVATAIYLEEYARNSWFAGMLEVIIGNLAGVPSVIYGLLGLELFVRLLGFGASLLAAACTLALLVLPIVIMSSREALRTVPDSVREGALALGATRWQMIRRVVLPVSLPGILTGAILAMSRAIGETAPLIIIGAVVFINFAPVGVDSPYTALPIQIFQWVSMPQREFLANAAAAIVVLLFVLAILNATAIWLRHRYEQRRDL